MNGVRQLNKLSEKRPKRTEAEDMAVGVDALGFSGEEDMVKAEATLGGDNNNSDRSTR